MFASPIKLESSLSLEEEALLRAVQNAAPKGVAVAQLMAQFPVLSRRTAQRWLAQWVSEGWIAAQGEGRGRRYLARPQYQAAAVPAFAAVEEPQAGWAQAATALLLAPDAQEVRAYVQQPLAQRAPVGYQRDLLESYQPNHSFYLPETVRRQLHAQGRTADATAPAGTYSRAVLNRLLIDLSWASSHMEGNTYSRLDTRRLIEEGAAAQGKGQVETQMILNHKAAIELLVDSIAQLQPGAPLWRRYLLMNLHAALAENLLPNPADEGRVRQHVVDIGLSVYRPIGAPQVLDELLGLVLAKVNAIADPFEQAFFMMVHLPYLQPFADINKRVSRLAANAPLFRANLAPLTFVGVPVDSYAQAMLGVYEMGRVELLRDWFIWAYERSTQEYTAIRQTLAEPDPLRLGYRALIKDTVRTVVQQPGADAIALVEQAVQQASPALRAELKALILDELRRLHEGVLARYGLRPGEWKAWQAGQGR
ncbi:Fic family protein [Comamonas sp. GB3 AK4-5]|uniref:Fic family protein n=1 Tax=Comamonas sp. GB3 AK4-5 TaxID=3231487 RepID=UPI00351DD7B5